MPLPLTQAQVPGCVVLAVVSAVTNHIRNTESSRFSHPQYGEQTNLIAFFVFL